jgi:4a-hydroxytetrahydrobiopterin dehydratase
LADLGLVFRHFSEVRDASRWLFQAKTYKAGVLAIPPPPNGEFRHVEWEGWGFAGAGDTTVYLVADPSDSLSVPAKDHLSGKFKGISCAVYRVHRLEKHWYTVAFTPILVGDNASELFWMRNGPIGNLLSNEPTHHTDVLGCAEQTKAASIAGRGVSMKKAMDADEIKEVLKANPEWNLKDGKLIREWSFKDFIQAMAFVNRVATLAEAAGHHPDIDIRYNQVVLGLISHDAGGVTQRDASMANKLSKEFPTA